MTNTGGGAWTGGELFGPAAQRMTRMQRRVRRPEHRWTVKSPAWGIQPVFIAPVLPGETLKGFTLQSRAVTDPIKDPLKGWWLEYYVFYVRHRDLSISAALQNMVLDPGSDQSASYGTADTAVTYHKSSSVTFNFAQECLKAVVQEYFRYGTDDWNSYMVDTSWAAAQVMLPGWMDSIVKGSDYDTESPDLSLSGEAQTVEAATIAQLLTKWDLLRAQGVIGDISYEDFLRSYGVKAPQQEELGRPELLRYVREWAYPTNTINASTGAPTSAVSWAVAARGDKDRFFREPGFIFACTVARPKVYVSYQEFAASHWLNDAYLWLPAVLSDDPGSSMRKYTAGTGPLPLIDIDYVVDWRDLFENGDQFTNWTVGATPTAGQNFVELPVEATLQRRFGTTTMADNLFVTTGTRYIRQDGIVSLNIASRVQDFTPATGL